ncbi:MAG TPA: SDR family oxidoreductase [Candidatus Acidoferrales bacterium]|nr:SDR family oxidoreductase [Candidatus Acidoferrales bacterium]
MRKILLVGGAGYIGAVLSHELLERGYAVRVLDRFFFGEQGLAEVRDRVEVVRADMRRVEAGHLDGVDTVINVGGLSNDPTAEYNPSANHEMNTVAAVRLAELARSAGVRRYLLASSCSVYDQAFTDDQRDLVYDEDAPVRPRAAYAVSKYEAEQQLLAMAGADFCPIILRKGTVYGFSPRMRFDLVVNTFVRDALVSGNIVLFRGGEMWRPLIDVHDVARAYIACVGADEAAVHGQIFNVANCNMRISELALRVRATLRELGVAVDVRPDYSYRGVRSYRVSTRKIERVLGFKAEVPVEDAVRDMLLQLRQHKIDDLSHPKYENIRWLRVLEEAESILGSNGSVFDLPPANVSSLPRRIQR